MFSWLPGTQRAWPAATIPMTSRSTPGESGPAVDEVAEEDRAPSVGRYGVHGTPAVVADQAVAELGRAGTPARSGSRARRRSTSKGPCSSRRSLSRRSRTMVAAATSSTPRSTWTWRKPSRFARSPQRLAQLRRLALDDARRRSRGRAARRCGRCRRRSGTSSTIATGSTSWALASARSCLRAAGWTFVASTTVSRPRVEPLADDDAEHLEGVLAGVLVVLVVGDQAAAEVAGDHLVGAEVLAREASTCRSRRRRPGPRGSATGSRSVVMRRLRAREHRELGRRPDLGVVGADRREPDGVAVAGGDGVGPGAQLGAGPLEAVVVVPHLAGGQALVADVVLGVRGGHHDHRRSRGGEHGVLEGGEPVGVDVLDDLHQHHGVPAGQPPVAVGQGRLERA